MAKVTATFLENKVAELNDWLQNHHKLDPLYTQKEQQRNYYVSKLSEIDEYDLKTIEI